MPVPLPLQPAGINLPPQPQDPPTLDDVVAAKRFQSQVDVAVASQLPGGPDEDDAARADIYKTSVISVHSALAGAPAWFQPSMNLILAPMKQMIARTANRALYDGVSSPFEILPFNDGSMPTAALHNLPPLTNVNAIRTLTAPQTIAYATGYGLAQQGGPAGRRAAIGRKVGCSVAI